MTDNPLAVGAVIAWCGWNPIEVVIDEVIKLNGNGSAVLMLPSLHVTAVSSVTVLDGWDNEYALTTGAGSADVSWSEEGVLTLRSLQLGRFPEGQQNVTVTYSGGYAEPPAELQAVLDSIAKRLSVTSQGLKSKSMGKARFDYYPDVGLSQIERLVLNRYKIVQSR